MSAFVMGKDIDGNWTKETRGGEYYFDVAFDARQQEILFDLDEAADLTYVKLWLLIPIDNDVQDVTSDDFRMQLS